MRKERWRFCNVENLDLFVRSYNCLKRANLHTVDKVVDTMQQDKLLAIRNLGENSRAEIHVKIYEFGYAQLCEKHKKEFVKNLLELNKNK